MTTITGVAIVVAVAFMGLLFCYVNLAVRVNLLEDDLAAERDRRHNEFAREAQLRNRRYHNFRKRQRHLEKLIIDAVQRREESVNERR